MTIVVLILEHVRATLTIKGWSNIKRPDNDTNGIGNVGPRNDYRVYFSVGSIDIHQVFIEGNNNV